MVFPVFVANLLRNRRHHFRGTHRPDDTYDVERTNRHPSLYLPAAQFENRNHSGRRRIFIQSAQFLQIWSQPVALGYTIRSFFLLTIDSGSHQILWARKDVNLAIADLRTLLKRQLPDGRIPEEINWLADKQGFFAKLGIRFQWSHVAYNDISQMPVLPYRCLACAA